MEADQSRRPKKRLTKQRVITKMIGVLLLAAAWMIPAVPESPWYIVKALVAVAGLIVLCVEPYHRA